MSGGYVIATIQRQEYAVASLVNQLPGQAHDQQLNGNG